MYIISTYINICDCGYLIAETLSNYCFCARHCAKVAHGILQATLPEKYN